MVLVATQIATHSILKTTNLSHHHFTDWTIQAQICEINHPRPYENQWQKGWQQNSRSSIYALNYYTFNPIEHTICVNKQSSSVAPSVVSGSF